MCDIEKIHSMHRIIYLYSHFDDTKLCSREHCKLKKHSADRPYPVKFESKHLSISDLPVKTDTEVDLL